MLGLNEWDITTSPDIVKKSWDNLPEEFTLQELNNLKFTMIGKNSNSLSYVWNDLVITFDFSPLNLTKSTLDFAKNERRATDYDLKFEIKNNSKNMVKINWDESLYVDFNNSSKAIVHEGIKHINKELPQTPSVIAPNTSSLHIIMPKDYINYQDREWRFDSYKFDKNIGGEFGIILSLETNGKKTLNTFRFRVDK